MHARKPMPIRASAAAMLLALSIAVGASVPHARADEVSMADPAITRHLEREFLYDPAIQHDGIDVSTAAGVVNLTGTADNLLAKERATDIAQTVVGVRAVVNRIEVVPRVTRSAEGVADDVDDALLFDAATDSFEIDVDTVVPGKVTLRGTVDSWAERDLAETVAKGVAGVTSVTNLLNVVQPAKRLDSEIESEISARLRWDALVDHGLIGVRVENGTVHLAGTVGSAAEKDQAEWDALVAGVKSVDSSGLKVEKWARDEALRKDKYVKVSDIEVRNAVQDALRYDPRVASFALTIEASNGHVTLQGVVDNIEAKQAAVRDARNTVGVYRVTSLIKVRPVVKLSDSEITRNVRDALVRNPFTEFYEIDVSTKNRVVTLEGTVDSNFEKAEAESAAFRANGVVRVRNSLKVRYPDTLVDDPYVYSWTIYDYPWYQTPTVVRKSDFEIAGEINDEMFWSPFVDADQVTVSVSDGVATLTGSVDSWGEYRAARENAFEGGAIGVINQLTVK